MKKLLINFYGQLWDIIFYIKNDLIAAKLMKVPVVLDEDKIVERICQNKASMCRFGDGEFSLMRGENLKFQKYNEKIAKELNEIIRSNNEDVLICIPDIFGSLQRYTLKVQRYWKKYLHKNRKNIYSLLKKNKTYYNALITRFYMDYQDKSNMFEKVMHLKEIWEQKDILIVEGEKSRLGMGNDLFANSLSIQRIICPAMHAYEYIDEIEEKVLKHAGNKLILIALGPTATVLAYRLSKKGKWALDIGHIDIEYEWYLRDAKEKCVVENKYIGEIPKGDIVSDGVDEIYLSQIIERI